MKKQVLAFCVLAVLLSCNGNKEVNNPETVVKEALAFPGVEGAGAYTTGGRGGLVYMVTNLDDDVAAIGSLRWALAQPGKKMIVFNVAGIIKLKRVLKIGSNVSILGQSAPGDGICIMGYPVLVEGDNVIVNAVTALRGERAVKGVMISMDVQHRAPGHGYQKTEVTGLQIPAGENQIVLPQPPRLVVIPQSRTFLIGYC